MQSFLKCRRVLARLEFSLVMAYCPMMTGWYEVSNNDDMLDIDSQEKVSELYICFFYLSMLYSNFTLFWSNPRQGGRKRKKLLIIKIYMMPGSRKLGSQLDQIKCTLARIVYLYICGLNHRRWEPTKLRTKFQQDLPTNSRNNRPCLVEGSFNSSSHPSAPRFQIGVLLVFRSHI
jgi:hypothetical protein